MFIKLLLQFIAPGRTRFNLSCFNVPTVRLKRKLSLVALSEVGHSSHSSLEFINVYAVFLRKGYFPQSSLFPLRRNSLKDCCYCITSFHDSYSVEGYSLDATIQNFQTGYDRSVESPSFPPYFQRSTQLCGRDWRLLASLTSSILTSSIYERFIIFLCYTHNFHFVPHTLPIMSPTSFNISILNGILKLVWLKCHSKEN